LGKQPVFDFIDTPSAEDLESIGKANEYVKSQKKIPDQQLESLYPGADPSATNLMKRILQSNPSKRCAADEDLKHEFLRDIRNGEMEEFIQILTLIFMT